MAAIAKFFGVDSLSRAKSAYENAKPEEKEGKKTEYVKELTDAIAGETDAAKKSELESTLNTLGSSNGMATQLGQGRRRKRKGGKHTKKHRKGSRRGRTGRKSSRL